MIVIDTGLKSTIDYTPTVAEVSAFLLAGNGVDALDFAMSSLIDVGLAWVLDTANLKVTYTTKPSEKWYYPSFDTLGPYATAELACSLFPYSGTQSHHSTVLNEGGASAKCYFKKTPTSEPIENTKIMRSLTAGTTKHILIDTVSNQILADAIEGNAASQATLTQITLDKFAADGLLAEIEAAAIPFS